MLRRALAVACSAAILAPTVTGADDRPAGVAIDWQRGPAAASCADGEALERAVAGQLERNRIADRDRADAVIVGRSERTATGWRAGIRVVRPDGELLGQRELTDPGPTCRGLDAALVVVLAMIVDSALVVPPPPPARDDERPVWTAPERAPPWRAAIAVGIQGEAGRLPGAAAAVGLAGRLELRAWPTLELAVAGWREATAASADGGARLRYLSAALLLCPARWQAGRATVEGCAGPQLGAIRARAYGFAENRTRREWMAELRGDLHLELAVAGRWFVRATISGTVAATRPSFTYETAGGATTTLYAPAIVAGTGQLAVGLRFP